MQKVVHPRLAGLVMAGLLALAVSAGTTATFVAERPGGDLQSVGAAEKLISLVQGQEHILWKSLAGPVSYITVRGWPVSDGEVELGGAMSITRPDGGEAGILEFEDKPMSASFEY